MGTPLPSSGHFSREIDMQSTIAEYCNIVAQQEKPKDIAEHVKPVADHLHKIILNVFLEKFISFISKIPLFTPSFRGKLINLITANTEAKKLLKLHNKIVALFNEGKIIPFDKNEKASLPILSLKIKSIKYENAILRLGNMPAMVAGSKQQQIESAYHLLPKKVQKTLIGILHFTGLSSHDKSYQKVLNLLPVIQKYKNSSGKDVFLQIAELLIEKKQYSDDLIALDACLRNPQLLTDPNFSTRFTCPDIKAKINSVEHSSRGVNHVIEYAQEKVADINENFRNIINKVDRDLSIYEASADRLAEKFGDDILKKPISVTMCSVEYQGFFKEGGLAEAVEGMAQGLLKQHPDNKVRLIYPKFSILPKAVLTRLESAPRTEHKDSHGNPFFVLKLDVNGVECFFIEHPLFEITNEARSIYGGNEDDIKGRFVAFSTLAADLLGQIPKTDIIHLHDWHVAGVEVKLRNQNKEIAPIVFTYHNNQRMSAQGRYFHDIYNYEPVMQALQQAGITSQNINLMVEAVKKADSITTVSNSFAVESQSIEMGEGISFAMRDAAKEEKLHGIVNGTDTSRWDPKKDPVLKNWKSLTTGEPIDLTYGIDSDDILAKKQLCKQELQTWVTQTFPDRTFDSSKPIITFIGRFDYDQKGLDKFEEGIQAALKNGAQVIIMGTGSIPEKGKKPSNSKELLDRLQEKYKSGVLILQDYKTEEGKLFYQQGTSQKQGIGSVVRAAADMMFLPSRFEPCGLVQFEGWLFGSLVVASNVGGFVDTVNPPNTPGFNGYLFDRGATSGSTSLQSTIKQAVDAFKAESPDARKARMIRTMSDGKKNGWNTSPSGYSPVEKYRFVYENAKINAQERIENAKGSYFDVKQFGRILRVFTQSEAGKIPLEETYLQAFYSGVSSRIKSLYKQLPDWLKVQMPTPYNFDVNHLEYQRLGAMHSATTTNFSVEAPNAKKVSLVLIDSEGKQKQIPMQRASNGSWNTSVDALPIGSQYQYLVDGVKKIDPFGLHTTTVEKAGDVPKSVVVNRNFTWDDAAWTQKRAAQGANQPLTMYEMHPTSWKTQDGRYLNYREIAEQLVEHCKTTGYTHVELMGILEHPHEGSQGYQVTNYFSPNSRMGSVEDFKFMVNLLHQNNIGVVLDWVPNHFALDDYALTKFDGTNQFEPSKIAALFSLRGLFMLKWGAKPFNFRKKSVRDFLISSAAYWIKEMHIDGLRVDAVRPILTSEHPSSARKFLRQFNEVIHKEFPGVLSIAEDYSGSLEATKATSVGGYGFDLKWNTNWSKNIMDYLKIAPKDRSMYYNRLIQAIEGDAHHKMIMAISHDEIGRSPLIDMTPGLTESEKCANLRALFSLQMCLPGKKLFFMGSEIGSSVEWAQILGRRQGLLNQDISEDRKKIQTTIEALSKLYKEHPGLWKKDSNARDLEWIEKKDPKNSFVAYRRQLDSANTFACFHNFSATTPKKYEIVIPPHLDGMTNISQMFNSNAIEFGGDGNHNNNSIQVEKDSNGHITKYTIWVAPLSAVVVKETQGNL